LSTIEQCDDSWVDSSDEGYEYNHSTFVDLIMSGLVGLRPGQDGCDLSYLLVISSNSRSKIAQTFGPSSFDVGLRIILVGNDRKLTVNPLIPPGDLPWWTADGVLIRGKIISVRFDVDGSTCSEE